MIMKGDFSKENIEHEIFFDCIDSVRFDDIQNFEQKSNRDNNSTVTNSIVKSHTPYQKDTGVSQQNSSSINNLISSDGTLKSHILLEKEKIVFSQTHILDSYPIVKVLCDSFESEAFISLLKKGCFSIKLYNCENLKDAFINMLSQGVDNKDQNQLFKFSALIQLQKGNLQEKIDKRKLLLKYLKNGAEKLGFRDNGLNDGLSIEILIESIQKIDEYLEKIDKYRKKTTQPEYTLKQLVERTLSNKHEDFSDIYPHLLSVYNNLKLTNSNLNSRSSYYNAINSLILNGVINSEISNAMYELIDMFYNLVVGSSLTNRFNIVWTSDFKKYSYSLNRNMEYVVDSKIDRKKQFIYDTDLSPLTWQDINACYTELSNVKGRITRAEELQIIFDYCDSEYRNKIKVLPIKQMILLAVPLVGTIGENFQNNLTNTPETFAIPFSTFTNLIPFTIGLKDLYHEYNNDEVKKYREVKSILKQKIKNYGENNE